MNFEELIKQLSKYYLLFLDDEIYKYRDIVKPIHIERSNNFYSYRL